MYEPNVVRRCAPGGLDESDFFTDLSPDLNSHLRNWLFGGGWYRAASLTTENTDRMTHKARCIIAEKLLSARCEAAAVITVEPFVKYRMHRRIDQFQRRIAKIVAP